MIRTQCPQCANQMQVPAHHLGREVRCDHCFRSYLAVSLLEPQPGPPLSLVVEAPATPARRVPKRPRGPKPPGQEKWTWEEIRLGHRLSKSSKRIRRMARSLGATEDENGRIIPPTGEEAPLYYLVFGGLLVASLVVAFFFPHGCHAK